MEPFKLRQEFELLFRPNTPTISLLISTFASFLSLPIISLLFSYFMFSLLPLSGLSYTDVEF